MISLLHYVRGAAALDIDSGAGLVEPSRYPDMLNRLLDAQRYPAIAAALAAGAFQPISGQDSRVDFHNGVKRVLDGIETGIRRSKG